MQTEMDEQSTGPTRTTVPAILSLLILVAALAVSACGSSPGAKLTDRIEDAEKQAQDTVDALLKASRVIAGQETSSAIPRKQRSIWSSFGVNRVHAQEGPDVTATPESQTKQETDIETLRGQWRPLYKAAQESYAELDAHIAYSERYADQYFRQQREHIENLKPAGNAGDVRTAMQKTYSQQVRYYEDWIDSAYQVKNQCDDMLDSMHNVNEFIEFATNAAQFQAFVDKQVAIPEIMASLDQAMPNFQSRTAGILGELERDPGRDA